jgi:SAM-dependent methyltransferase
MANGVSMDSVYFDLELVAQLIAQKGHRAVVGDEWDLIGKLQFSFLTGSGLLPHHRLLDVGCGAMRGGVHFAAYLNPGCYFGVDISPNLLEKGREELARAGVSDRVPLENISCSDNFSFEGFNQAFDFAIAQSLFTHLGFNRVRRCLEQISDVLSEDGKFFVTFFERPQDVEARVSQRHPPEMITTYDVSDPYHYSAQDLAYACQGLPLEFEYIGEWGHPRGQKIASFNRRISNKSTSSQPTRRLTVDEASRLSPGDDHYRSFVGPTNRFDFMSATQFSLLFSLGLVDTHKILDIGCGSLRLGRLMIPFLRKGHYFGIEPNQWLIEDAFRFELGFDIVRVKEPRISHNSDFDCTVFDTSFDFVMAQSIATHCGPDLLRTLIANAAVVLAEKGLFALSYCRADAPISPPADGWHYPGCVRYEEQKIAELLKDVGLVGRAIPWFHPGASWYLAARSQSVLPRDEELCHLEGVALRHPLYEASRP